MRGPYAFLAAALLLAAGTLAAQEVQHHGLVFEQWGRRTSFGGDQPARHTQKWDIPARANRDHGGMPANLQAVKYGASVDLSDALRQYEIKEPFLLGLGFWQQDGDVKRLVHLIAPPVTPERWESLWAPVTYADLLKLDQLIKDPARPVEEVRRLALRIKGAPPFSQAIRQVNPKIDAHQRRLQCALRSADVFKHLVPGVDPTPQAVPTLWGVPFPAPLAPPPPGRNH